MTFIDYFQSYENYFWQWEEENRVIAIPGGNTIAYKELVMDVLDKLVPQGLPPFGALLLVMVATNPKGRISLDIINSMITEDKQGYAFSPDAMDFLKLLSTVPQEYKEGKNRILLLQAIFDNCHHILSLKDSKRIRDSFTNSNKFIVKVPASVQLAYPDAATGPFSKKKLTGPAFKKDAGTIHHLKKRFPTVESILKKIASLPEIDEEIIIVDETDGEENENPDLVEQLISDSKTFYVGSLIKRIWSGLNIPVHSALPSEQPLGGISDLTNKGDFDKLLISEFANEDIVFLSRLANNEALYIHREIPPATNNLQRVILIDASLKNWGTPKTIAFATMLAIAEHPKTNIECSAFVIGSGCFPVSIENVGTIIDGLQMLEGGLHAANGLAAFFDEYPAVKNREIFLITEPSTLKQPAMLKALNDYHALINYRIFTDAQGNIDIYKKQQNSNKHIQHILLPLKELWTKEQKKTGMKKSRNEKSADFPLLFRNSLSLKKLLSTSDGEVFQVTNEKTLLHFFDKSARQYEKGWELVLENLPFAAGEFEMGILTNGERMLLMFNPQNKEITLLNIDTNEKKQVLFTQWKSTTEHPHFIFHQQNFFHLNNTGMYSISADGGVEKLNWIDRKLFSERDKELKALQQKYSYTQSIFKNINDVFINESNNLVFNIHELRINQGYHIKLDTTQFRTKKVKAVRNSNTEYVFDDGSSIEINRSGMLILKSSNDSLPFIYIPSSIDESLGLAAGTDFAGNEYFYKEELLEVTLMSAGKQPLTIIKQIKEFTDYGLKESKDMVDSAPSIIFGSVSKTKAELVKKTLEGNGAQVQLSSVNREYAHFNKITTTVFYRNYIESFIQTICAHGAKN